MPEQHSLAANEPERVRDLSAQWEAWAKRVGVEPWPVQKPAPKKP